MIYLSKHNGAAESRDQRAHTVRHAGGTGGLSRVLYAILRRYTLIPLPEESMFTLSVIWRPF